MFDIDKPKIGKKEKEYLLRCVKDCSIGQGAYVNRFEKEFADYCGIKYSCAVMNGTAALHLALLAIGVGPGDEVLVPSLTFIASVSPISYCGAKPVFVDCDPKTWCVDVEDMKRKVTPRTKAVIPVHLYGNACDMDGVRSIAGKHGIRIVEDCAEAHGTLYKGRQVGVFSDVAFFSFYKNKHITTGEGGMCLTDDKGLIEKIRLLRSHGKDKTEDLSDEDFARKQFISRELGFNYRMTDMQAAVGLAQLSQIEGFIRKRIRYADIYRKALNIPGVTLPVCDPKTVRNTYWGFPVLLRSPEEKVRIMIDFRRRDLRLRSFFNPCQTQPFYSKPGADCPVSEDVSSRGLVLPNIHSMEEKDVRMVAGWIKDALKRNTKDLGRTI